MLNSKAAARWMAASRPYTSTQNLPPQRDDGKQSRKLKCEAADAVEARDPGVPYESRWAPYVRIHGPGQGQFPKGSIRPRGYVGS
jgi:hypothetical protein